MKAQMLKVTPRISVHQNLVQNMLICAFSRSMTIIQSSNFNTSHATHPLFLGRAVTGTVPIDAEVRTFVSVEERLKKRPLEPQRGDDGGLLLVCSPTQKNITDDRQWEARRKGFPIDPKRNRTSNVLHLSSKSHRNVNIERGNNYIQQDLKFIRNTRIQSFRIKTEFVCTKLVLYV